MRDKKTREAALTLIGENIARSGFHTYVVTGGGDPRYGYTIGLSQSQGAELIFAGAYFYLLDDVPKIIDKVATDLKLSGASEWRRIDLGSLGAFTLRKVHTSWASTLLLGALDYYGVKTVEALQIVPDEAHWTSDVPNLSLPWSSTEAPAWRWLHEEWTYPVPSKSMAVTNLGALRGDRVTEVMRWEDDEWEMFAGAGPDIAQDQRRVVPLGVLLATDKSLLPIVDLPVGAGFWRDAASEWHPWGNSGEAANA